MRTNWIQKLKGEGALREYVEAHVGFPSAARVVTDIAELVEGDDANGLLDSMKGEELLQHAKDVMMNAVREGGSDTDIRGALTDYVTSVARDINDGAGLVQDVRERVASQLPDANPDRLRRLLPAMATYRGLLRKAEGVRVTNPRAVADEYAADLVKEVEYKLFR